MSVDSFPLCKCEYSYLSNVYCDWGNFEMTAIVFIALISSLQSFFCRNSSFVGYVPCPQICSCFDGDVGDFWTGWSSISICDLSVLLSTHLYQKERSKGREEAVGLSDEVTEKSRVASSQKGEVKSNQIRNEDVS